MRIGVLSPWDLDAPESWSGVCQPAVRALGDIAQVTKLQAPIVTDALVDRVLAKLLGYLGVTYLPSDAFLTAYKKKKAVEKLLAKADVDLVLSLAASKESLGVPRTKPLVQITDSSFTAMVEGYFNGKKLSRLTRFQGAALDRLVAKRSKAYCVASQWSKEQIMRDTGLAADAITVVPFGPAVLPQEPKTGGTGTAGLKLLFVASHWERKGGDTALAAFAAAHELRPDLSLTIVGSEPRGAQPGVTYLPRVPQAELSRLYLSHDALLEPTQASAGGVVVTDALNHGLPVIATMIGGIPSIVEDGKTGWLVPTEDSAEHIKEVLLGLTPSQVASFSEAAWHASETRLNWAVWAKTVRAVCAELMR